MTQGNQARGDDRDKEIPEKPTTESPTVDEMNASLESETQRSVESSQSAAAQKERERLRQTILPKADYDSEQDHNQGGFWAKTNKKPKDNTRAEPSGDDSDDEKWLYRQEPQPQPRTSPTQEEGPFRYVKMVVNSRIAQQQTESRSSVSSISSTQREMSEELVSSPPSSATSGDDSEPQRPRKRVDSTRLAEIRRRVREARQQNRPREAPNGLGDREATPSSSSVTSEDGLKSRPSPRRVNASTLAAIRARVRANNQRQTEPRETPNRPCDGEASHQRSTPQKTAKSPANKEASQQPTTPRIVQSPANGVATQKKTATKGTPNRPTHAAARPQPATPAASNPASEYNPFVSEGPTIFNLSGPGLEDFAPKDILRQLSESSQAAGTDAPEPPASNTQPPPVVVETPNTDGHDPFTGRRGPPSFGNLTTPGLEGFNGQNILGQGAVDPSAAPASRWLPSPLADMNDAIATFEAYREPLPPPPEDSSEEDEHMDGSPYVNAERQQAPNRDMAQIRVFSPTASPTGSVHNGRPGRASSEYRLAQLDCRDSTDSDSDIDSAVSFALTASPTSSDPDDDVGRLVPKCRLSQWDRPGSIDFDNDGASRLPDLDEDELGPWLVLNPPNANHHSDEDEGAHTPNYGGHDSNYEATPPRRNMAPEPQRRPDSPLRLGNHRVVEPPRTPNASQILRNISNPLPLGGRSGTAGSSLRPGNHEVAKSGDDPFPRLPNNPFGLDNPKARDPENKPFRLVNDEARRQAANPFSRLGSAIAGVKHASPGTAPEWSPRHRLEPQPTDAARVFDVQFRNPSGPGVTYTRNINERAATFTRYFARNDLGFREEREPTPPPQGPRATFIRQGRRNAGIPVAWRVSLRVSKRIPRWAGPRNMPRGANRSIKSEKSDTESRASHSRAGSGPMILGPDYLTRPFRRVLEEQVERHAQRHPFTPPRFQPTSSTELSPSPEPESLPELRDLTRNDQQAREDDEALRLIAEATELDEADQELFREVMLETVARAGGGLEIPSFFAPVVAHYGCRQQERRGNDTRCAPDTEPSEDVRNPTPSDRAVGSRPQVRRRHIRPRPANITYPCRPFSDLLPTPGPPSPRPYSLREATTEAIRGFPRHLMNEIENGNIDGWLLLFRVLMISILIWALLVIAMGDGEDQEVHWYVARGESRMWQAGS